MGAKLVPDPLRPIWIDLHRAIEAHVDAADRAEFLDTIVTTADLHDRHQGPGAGDRYIARVIRSLSGSLDADGEHLT